MIYHFDEIIDRTSTESVKWRAHPQDVLPLWVADMDFACPEPVVQALLERIKHPIYGYPKNPDELSLAFVDWSEKRYSWQIQPEWLVWIPGVVTGFNIAAHMIAEPGAAVLIQPPVYPPFLAASGNAGLLRQDAPLAHLPNGSYEIDFEALQNAITPATKMLILCNPHNPVGRVFTPAELCRLAEFCLDHEILICSDEIHCDLIYSGRQHTPIARLDPEIAAHSITLMAPSKTFNIAGLQCSVAIIPDPKLRARYRQAQQGLVPWVNMIGQVGALAAYRHGLDWLDQVMGYLEANRDFLSRVVRDELPGVKMALPQGTYLAWLDCREAGIPGAPGKFFVEAARVALNEGATFGLEGEGFVRLNFGCPRSVLAEALDRMRFALQSLPKA
jgi:cystathionine beta-lyase